MSYGIRFRKESPTRAYSDHPQRLTRLPFARTSTCSRVRQKSRGPGACGGNSCDRQAFCEQGCYSSGRVSLAVLVDFQRYQCHHLRHRWCRQVRFNVGLAFLQHLVHPHCSRPERDGYRNCHCHRYAENTSGFHHASQPSFTSHQSLVTSHFLALQSLHAPDRSRPWYQPRRLHRPS